MITTDSNRFNVLMFRMIRLLFRIIGLIPRKWAIRFANSLGLLWYGIDKKHRRITIENLSRAYGNEKSPDQIRELSKNVFQNIMQIPFEIGWSFSLNADNWHKHFRIEGLSKIKSIYARGGGVFLLTAHVGNWELLPLFALIAGIEAHMIYRPLDFKPLDLFFLWLRTRYGGKVIPLRKATPKIVKAVENGELVVFLTDQSADWYDGVYVDFFGRMTCTNKGLAMMAEKTGTPVAPVFTAREGEQFYIEFQDEIPMSETGDRIKDMEANTQAYNDRIENFIRRYPEQWFWLHRRWKHKPWSRWPKE